MSIEVCRYSGVCSGCEWIQKPFAEQIELKKQELTKLWVAQGLDASNLLPLEFIKTSEFQSRDRVDLIIKTQNAETNAETSVGLYDISRSSIVNIESCPQMSPELENWYRDFRKTIPPIEIGSFRLRISPEGQRGVWLDLPNLTTKELLDNGKWFTKLLEHAEIEVGQKRKRLKLIDEKLKLAEPELGPWFQTYLGENQTPAEIYCLIGGFSQPGFQTNKKLVLLITEYIRKTNAKRWLELGSGSGNLTLPLASVVETVIAVEMDEGAVEGLKLSAKKANLSSRIQTVVLNFHKPSQKLKELIEKTDAMLVDPPRSGLGGTLEVLKDLSIKQMPKDFLYVSCFPKSFVEDSKALLSLGYKLKQIAIVDQFPQSSHYEIVAGFTLPFKLFF